MKTVDLMAQPSGNHEPIEPPDRNGTCHTCKRELHEGEAAWADALTAIARADERAFLAARDARLTALRAALGDDPMRLPFGEFVNRVNAALKAADQ